VLRPGWPAGVNLVVAETCVAIIGRYSLSEQGLTSRMQVPVFWWAKPTQVSWHKPGSPGNTREVARGRITIRASGSPENPLPSGMGSVNTGGTSIADDLTRYFQLDEHAGKEQQDVKPFRDKPRG
jgi:hypothetical protein